MIRPLLVYALLLVSLSLGAQESDCNKLGVWLWHVEATGFGHKTLAQNLAARNIKRVYVKVADGRVNPDSWPELIDTQLVNDYQQENLEVWAWSYNYTANYELQAAALYEAAKTGYQGYVVDVEMEFDGKAGELDKIFAAFYDSRERAISDGYASSDFQIYCTTWGNPIDHNYSIESIDPYVDGYMPQTYVEYWGQSYVNNITYWIEEGNKEYESIGATKPIHHLCSTALGVMTPELINEFVAASGPETSLWRVPGGGVPFEVWEDWNQVDWDMDFCEPTQTEEIHITQTKVYPNPATNMIFIELPFNISNEKVRIELHNLLGKPLRGYQLAELSSIDVSDLAKGCYILSLHYNSQSNKPSEQHIIVLE